MDILDNIIFATLNRNLTGQPGQPGRQIMSDYLLNPVGAPIGPNPQLTTPGVVNMYNYTLTEKMNYCSCDDAAYIEKGILRHWSDIDAQDTYPHPAVPPANQFSSFVF